MMQAAVTMLAIAALSSAALNCAMAAQIDTFQDGTTQNWLAGGGPFGQAPPVPPMAVATGGPGGAGDRFLQITANGGDGPGSRLTAINTVQWAGDYADAGLSRIEMDLINLGASDLSIRLLFEDPMGGPSENRALTTFAALLPVGSGWMHFGFDIEPADLTALTGNAATLLGQVTVLRIIHNAAPNVAAPVAGSLGVDNIEGNAQLAGVAIAEPGDLPVLAFGLLGLWAARSRAFGHPRAR
jgi:hypothetical protein